MAHKDFDGERFSLTAFDDKGGSRAFVRLRMGHWARVQIDAHLTADEARELAATLMDAAAFAEPRIGTPADLGCEAL